MIDIFSSNKNC